MGKTQTRDIAGAPDDFGTVYRGTSVLGMVLILPLLLWDIPLFLNRTDHLTTWYYKNEGRIHFTRDGFVRQVIYDPSEDGYRGE